MNKPTGGNAKKEIQRKLEESIKNAAAVKKSREKPVGRAVPQPRSAGIEKNSSPMPFNARNGDVKRTT